MVRSPLNTATSKRATRAPPRADELADLVLLDHEGAERRLGDFWRDGAAILVFLRHYG